MQKRRVSEVGRTRAVVRAQELKRDALDYLEVRDRITCGMDLAFQTRVEARKRIILRVLGGTEDDWNDWKWQMKNRVRDADLLAEILSISPLEKRRIASVGKTYRWAVSPYYLSLIGDDYRNDPVYLQSVPDIQELLPKGELDPMDEEGTSPAPCVTRRYPDRLIINVTNQCAMFCRHCQRRRNIGEVDRHATRQEIKAALQYVKANPEMRDVLVTGGDALLLSDKTLEWILMELDRIPHVEIKRIGTRVPVTLPQRVTPELCEVLRKYPPIYINTQFNHPAEVTPEAKQACDMLVQAGAVLGNQAVLLRGINDCPEVMRRLNHELLRIRVRPYYIFHPKPVRGTSHRWVSIQTGLEIMEALRGHTSGLAVPTYIVNAPDGLGKIPLMPQYLLKLEPEKAVLRTWEGKIVEVENLSW